MGRDLLAPPNTLRSLDQVEINGFYEIARRFTEEPDHVYNLALFNVATLFAVNPAPVPFVGISQKDGLELNMVQQWGVFHANHAPLNNQMLLDRDTHGWWNVQRLLLSHLVQFRPRDKVELKPTSLLSGALMLKGFGKDTI